MKKGPLIFLFAAVALVSGGRPASATIILDSDFFAGTTYSVITFETDGLGNRLNLADGQVKSMPGNEYARYGFTFEPDVSWVNVAGAAFDEAQAIGGSPAIAIAGPDADDFTISFSVPVRAFGFWVISNPAAADETSSNLTLEAYGADGLIEEATFEGDAIDGVTGSGTEYGFLGIASEKFITSVHVVNGAATLDNFTYSPVPEPATVILLGLGCLVLLRRRPA